MPDVEITIGGRTFQVACQPGEDHFLRAAATLLDNEAQPLVAQMGRMPEARMLLMSALMLADRTAALEDELRATKNHAASLETRASQMKAGTGDVPVHVTETMAELAARAEALASAVEERIGASRG
jgi:cell division protein ZapA